MAFTASVTTASIRLSSVLALQERITFDDIEGGPSTTINWMSSAVLNDIDLKTAVTPGASNPNEVATTQIWGGIVTGVAGTATLDLTALPRDACLAALDLTGLKIQGYLMQVPYDDPNTDETVNVVPAGANGYNLLNSAGTDISLAPGGIELCWFPENSTSTIGMPDVGASAKDLTITSSNATFTLFVALFAG